MGDWALGDYPGGGDCNVSCPRPARDSACRQSWAGNVFGYEFNFCAGFLFNLMSKSNSAEWWAAGSRAAEGEAALIQVPGWSQPSATH